MVWGKVQSLGEIGYGGREKVSDSRELSRG